MFLDLHKKPSSHDNEDGLKKYEKIDLYSSKQNLFLYLIFYTH